MTLLYPNPCYNEIVYGPRLEQTSLWCLQTTKVQTSLRTAQTDQLLCYSLLESIISKLDSSKISIF